MFVFGTRPEAIKLAPVMWALRRRPQQWRCINVNTSQHEDLLQPMLGELHFPVHHDLRVMRASQSPNDVLSKVLALLAPLVHAERPDVLVVQGDTTTALAGAMVGFHARVPVAHVEAGLRVAPGATAPFPEEMNRRLISQLASLHYAATRQHAQALFSEGVPADRVWVTGNPVVDTLRWISRCAEPSWHLRARLQALQGQRLLVLTTHRRENQGAVMLGHLQAVAQFVREHADVSVLFPVHPSPAVRQMAEQVLGEQERVHLLKPLGYADFVHLLSHAWLVVSDSGGVQEEAPSLGKPLLILRDCTERPEVLACGVGRLAGLQGPQLLQHLRQAHADPAWASSVRTVPNPFGDGSAGERVGKALTRHFAPHALARVSAS
jgi:UDP-N-acetylglucosamine 2-epimerase (non-hydrolysing)